MNKISLSLLINFLYQICVQYRSLVVIDKIEEINYISELIRSQRSELREAKYIFDLLSSTS